ncbi:ATP-binding cassette domain-containing protein [Paenibacillus thiaminolyticus]|uniref:ABC transporter ATP-binding protein n=1 Tax=Paenibacillus thiaminolyticus TaxID=49283 RepID=A0A3A3GD14_PANTH|nr:ABC transporter ATP-binding protein [Paenibacillus thiaminolyticus]RJG20623.1 ABC transporter ATP-binding protein [Paenibacillus thiaminolyticus]
MYPKLEIDDLTFSYRQEPVLEHLSLRIYPGERVCIKGKNGSGKSTLLKIISGLIYTEASILFNGMPVKDMRAYKKRIAYISDTPYLYDLLTGRENLAFFLHMWGIEDKHLYWEKAESLAGKFNLTDALDKTVSSYSLGMKHKLFFIGMYARETEIFLLDEPLSALDQESQQIMIDFLLQYSYEESKSVIFVSHLQDLEKTLANRIYYLSDRHLVEKERNNEEKNLLFDSVCSLPSDCRLL